MGKKDDVFLEVLKGKNIPPLSIDRKWHRVFKFIEKTPEIEKLEKNLNDYIQKQGGLTVQLKEVKALKKKLMDEVVSLADMADKTMDKQVIKKLEASRRLIVECNDKYHDNQLELTELAGKIKQVNNELMLNTMEICYECIQENTDIKIELTEQITVLRQELKKNAAKKAEAEVKNEMLYTYMHAIFGAEVIDIFDMRYDPSEQIEKKREMLLEKKAKEERAAKVQE